LSPAALDALVGYAWPGNVRELVNVVERAALLHPGRVLEPEMLGLGPAPGTPVAIAPDGVSVDFSRGPVDMEALERTLLERALRHTRWNRAQAAQLLGLTKETLRYRIEKFRLAPEPRPD
jgi:DNA-binding NtrC family response regulator